jgi:pyruvate dehydrogenase E2 component (dihydrolipoamide acetyltransferase)
MGESIAEGTIVRWIKKLGDKVDRDEPLFEISTDKVDAEIPSPAAGVVTEIRAKEGETVPVNSVVAVIGQAGEGATAKPAAPPASSPQADGASTAVGQVAPRPTMPPPAVPPPSPPAAPPPSPPASGPSRVAGSVEEAIQQRSSPLVRKIAQEHNVDISQIQGTGISGRVTKQDILGYIEGSQRPEPRAATPARPTPAPSEGAAFGAGESVQVVPMSVMRRKIAEHMIMSRRTSAHVHSVFEVSFARIAQIREAKKAEYERAGAKLTYLSFIIKAAVDALRAMPIVNASVDANNIVYHRDINVGIAVALDWGLIVPVIKNADERNLLGLSRAVVDLAARARNKQLKPDEVAGGTFTITNPGVFGALFGMPIISQPQVAILGIGNVEKRPVVIDDAIAIRPMAYLSLGYDHRVIDGAIADQFMSNVKRALENWDPGQA